jgi:acyl-CoA thioesterase-1
MRLVFSQNAWMGWCLLCWSLVACGDPDSPAADPADSPAVEPRTGSGGSAAPDTAPQATTPSDLAAPDPGAPEATVVFVGTSLTAGYGLDDPAREAWPERVAELAREAGTPMTVVNAGVSGDTSAGGLRRIVALLDPRPDAVVLELGANDGLRGLPIAELEQNLDAAVDSIRRYAPDAAIVVARMEAPRNLGAEYVEAFAAVFDSIGERPGVAVTPFLLEDVAGIPGLNQPDGIHPVAAGHRRMAEVVWPVLRRRLVGGGGAR